MSKSTNNTTTENTADNKAWSTAARDLLAAHPHIVGVTVAALAAALSHFYYGHSPLTVAAWAAAGLITGEALSRILAHSAAIMAAAEGTKATAEALKNAAAAVPAMAAAIAEANAKMAAMEAELKKLREEHAAAEAAQRVERANAEAFRAEAMKAKAEAEAEGKKSKAA